MTLQTGSFAGVVLAAGRSSRMGSPKALLRLDGSTFLARIVGALAAGGCEPVVVVTGPEEDEDARLIAEEARRLGALVVTNPDRGSPQVESIRAAVAILGQAVAGALITPVDAPALEAELVGELIAVGREGAPVGVPTFGGRRGHPVMFGRRALADLGSSPLPEGARTLLRRYQDGLVEVPAGSEVLLDVDTPDDYQALSEGRR